MFSNDQGNPSTIRSVRANLRKQFESDLEAVQGTRKIWLNFDGRHNHNDDDIGNINVGSTNVRNTNVGSTNANSGSKNVEKYLTVGAKIIDAIHQLVWQGKNIIHNSFFTRLGKKG